MMILQMKQKTKFWKKKKKKKKKGKKDRSSINHKQENGV